MRTGFRLPFLSRLIAILIVSFGSASAAPVPDEFLTSELRGTSTDSDTSAPAADPVQQAAKDLTGVKDESRLPSEPDATETTSKPGDDPPKPVRKVEPRPVPAISRGEFCTRLAQAAQRHDLPVALFANLIWQESKFDPHAVSHAGALGVAQFMPAVAKEVGLSNPFNPLEALPAAARFLSGLVERFGSIGLATAAYNAGPTRVGNWLKSGKGLPKETRNYVHRITGKPAEHWRSAKSDGVFAMAKGLPCQLGVFAEIERFDPTDSSEQREIKLRASVRPVKSGGSIAAAKAAITSKARRAMAAKGKSKSTSVANVRKSKSSRSRVAGRKAERRVKVAGGR